jgi:hypothetical protein
VKKIDGWLFRNVLDSQERLVTPFATLRSTQRLRHAPLLHLARVQNRHLGNRSGRFAFSKPCWSSRDAMKKTNVRKWPVRRLGAGYKQGWRGREGFLLHGISSLSRGSSTIA